MVCRISESLLNLQQHGNSDYVGWVLHFDCFAEDILKHLEDQAKEMENDLVNWKRDVQSYRNDFYELNYYTTQQLLILREELGRLRKPGAADSLDSKTCIMLSLLQSVSGDVTLECVRKELQVFVSAPMQEEVIPDQVHKMVPTHTVCGKVTKAIPGGSVSLKSIPDKSSYSGDESELMETDLVRDILCSTADDKPSISEADLNDAQRKIMLNIVENYGYSRKLILLGF